MTTFRVWGPDPRFREVEASDPTAAAAAVYGRAMPKDIRPEWNDQIETLTFWTDLGAIVVRIPALVVPDEIPDLSLDVPDDPTTTVVLGLDAGLAIQGQPSFATRMFEVPMSVLTQVLSLLEPHERV